MDYKKSVASVVFADLAFLFILGCSGLADGAISEVLYVLAFIIPLVAVLTFSRGEKAETELGVRLGIKKESLIEFIPLVFPSIVIIMLAALLVSFILTHLGLENPVTVYPTLAENVLHHALLPAVLEEALFRYLPLRLLARYSKRRAVLLSSLLFAFIHCNLFQIPYAYLAGILLSSLCLAYGSILPSLILHLINNTVSVLLIYYDADGIVYALTSALAVISLIFVFTNRQAYFNRFKEVFADKCKFGFTYYPAFIIITTTIAAISAIM